MLAKKILTNPFIIGLASGLLTGNLSLGLITTGFSVLIWGYHKELNFIIPGTVILVILSGNVNFELVFLYFITITYCLKQEILLDWINGNKKYYIAAIVSIALFPVWRLIFSRIPAQVLDEINMSGGILLLTGFILTARRGFKLIKKHKYKSNRLLRFLLIIIMAGLGIMADYFVVFVWIIGVYFLNRMSTDQKQDPIFISPLLQLIILLILTGFKGFILIPVNMVIIGIFIVLLIYLYLKKELISLELVYFSFVISLVVGRLGLLN